jgi:phage recombination protein Bet
MGTEIVTTHGSPVDLDREQMDLLKRNFAPNASDGEFELFAHVAQTLGLSPQARQIYAVSRRNSKTNQYEMTIQWGIDGLRLIAERTGMYGGTDAPLWCGPNGQWSELWLDEKEPPTAAKVCVWRRDAQRPTVGVALYREFVQKDRYNNPTGQWGKMPAQMLAIAAERQALRKAFQHDIDAAEALMAKASITVDEIPQQLAAPGPKQLTSPHEAAPGPSAQAPQGNDAAPATASTARDPESAGGGRADHVYDSGQAPTAARETPTKSNSGPVQPTESPPVTGFFELLQQQCGLDRAGVRRILQVSETSWSDETAVRNALTMRDLGITPKGLGELATTVATLHAAATRGAPPATTDVPSDTPPTPEGGAEDFTDELDAALSDAVRVLRDDLEPAEAF